MTCAWLARLGDTMAIAIATPEFHGTATHSYSSGAEAGRGRRGLQQPGPLQGIQVAVVSRRAQLSAEDLFGVVHRAADYDRRLDTVFCAQLPGRRFEFRDGASAGCDRRPLGGSSGRNAGGPARSASWRMGGASLRRAVRF